MYCDRKLTTSFALGVSFWLCLVAGASGDTVLETDAAGAILGLPDDYSPAVLLVERSVYKPTGISLQIGETVTALPDCIVKELKGTNARKLEVRASWGHDLGIWPRYLRVLLPRNRSPDVPFRGYEVYFHLDSARFMILKKIIVKARGRKIYHERIDIESICDPDEIQDLDIVDPQALVETRNE